MPSLDLHKRRKGFTMIEIMIVLGIIGILYVIVLLAVNPSDQLCDSKDAERKVYAHEIQNAIYQYLISEWSPPTVETIPIGAENKKYICRDGITEPTCINFDLMVPDYLFSIPIDRDETNTNHSGFSVYNTAIGRTNIISDFLGICN